MIEEMTEQEIDRLLRATVSADYAFIIDDKKCLIHKVSSFWGKSDPVNAMYLLNLGQILERIDKAVGEEYENLPEINTNEMRDIVEKYKNNPPADIAEKLFDCVFSMQREAFRYGYYAALENEKVVL